MVKKRAPRALHHEHIPATVVVVVLIGLVDEDLEPQRAEVRGLHLADGRMDRVRVAGAQRRPLGHETERRLPPERRRDAGVRRELGRLA